VPAYASLCACLTPDGLIALVTLTAMSGPCVGGQMSRRARPIEANGSLRSAGSRGESEVNRGGPGDLQARVPSRDFGSAWGAHFDIGIAAVALVDFRARWNPSSPTRGPRMNKEES
jgi:hypothetical protein